VGRKSAGHGARSAAAFLGVSEATWSHARWGMIFLFVVLVHLWVVTDVNSLGGGARLFFLFFFLISRIYFLLAAVKMLRMKESGGGRFNIWMVCSGSSSSSREMRSVQQHFFSKLYFTAKQAGGVVWYNEGRR